MKLLKILRPMKALLFCTFFCYSFFAFTASASAQSSPDTAFYQLEDLTGYDSIPKHLADSINVAALSLRDALPEDYRSNFGVYDLGFYHHHSSYEGGIPDVITNAIASRVTHSYYLLFGREMDNEGNLKKVWVEMKLPEGDYLACLESAQKTFHAHMAGTFLNGPAIIGKNDSYQYKEQVKAAVGYLSGIFAEFEICCDQGSGFRSLESCSFCTQKIHDFRSFMEAYGFIGIEVENLVVSTYFDTTGSIREYTSATAELAGDTINVNADVIGFLNRMDNAMDGIYGSLYYYDPLEPVICKNILEEVAGVSSPPIALKEGGVTRSSPEEVVMDITTIITKDEDGNAMIHQRVEIPVQMTNTGKTIYLKCLDDCGFNMDSIKIYLTNFYSLLGKYPIEVWPDPPAAGPPVTDSILLIPDIQVSTQKLTKEIVRDGVVVLFGEASKIIDRLQSPDWYRDLAGQWGTSEGGYKYSVVNIVRETSILGKGQSSQPKRFALVVTDRIQNRDPERYRAHNHNHLCSFIAFHELGHTTGLRHYEFSFNSQIWAELCESFMSHLDVILANYLGVDIYPNIVKAPNCGLEFHGKMFSGLDSFVLETMNHSRYIYIKRSIYNRFFN